MSPPVSRRSLLATLGASVTAGLAGCERLTELFPTAGRVDDAPQSRTGSVTGRVRDPAAPIADARVEALGRGGTRLGGTRTDGDGTFSLRTNRPVWLRVTAGGYVERTVTARPGTPVGVTLLSADGTAALAFGGDVMFGRRFYEAATDHLAPRHQIRPSSRRSDHERVLADIEPLLQSADLTSVNLESPLTTADIRHPEKSYTFTSHPVAAEVLADVGVNYAALGNNHVFDALDSGLRTTTRELESAGLAHSGAGEDADSAWAPATVEVPGLTVALLSCTTVAGTQYDLHWSADRTDGRPARVSTAEGDRTVPAGAGVAEATADRLERRIEAAEADIVVVQIHGGEQYQPSPTPKMRRLTDRAVEAGADLVVNHHPHVTGGIEHRDGSVIAWSLGNLVFDQTLWATFPSALLTAYVSADGVRGVAYDPLLLDGFVPRGIVGKPARTLAWRLADRSGERARLTDSGVVTGAGARSTTTETVDFDAGTLYGRYAGWIRQVDPGRVRLGRDLLPTGTFESVDVDETGYDGALWRFSRDPSVSAAEFGVDESGGVRLRRIAGNSADVVLSNSRRIPVDGPLTALTQYRTASSDGIEFEAAWYDGTGGESISRDRWALPATDGTWRRYRRALSPPDGATHLNVIVSVSPPRSGRRSVSLDDVRLVAWDDGASGGRVYDHVDVREAATASLVVPAGDEGDWRSL